MAQASHREWLWGAFAMLTAILALVFYSVLFVVTAILAGVGIYKAPWFPTREPRIRAGLKVLIMFGVCALLFGLWLFVPQPDLGRELKAKLFPAPVIVLPSPLQSPSPIVEVYPPFRDAYNAYPDELGDAKQSAEKLVPAYYAEHEHATVIWIPNDNLFYLLDSQRDHHKSMPGDDKWIDSSYTIEDCNRKRFPPPEGLYPPYGGVAVGWALHPNDWRWIGWRISHYYYPDAHIQRFQNGFIVGMFRRDPKQDRIGQVAFVLLNKGVHKDEWHSKVSFPTGEEENLLPWVDPKVDKLFNEPCKPKLP